MDPRPLPWALVLLGPALILVLGCAAAPDTPEKLCGRHFVRALVRVCGGPHWSPEPGRLVAGSNREPLQWLEGRHLHGLVANRDSMLLPNPQPLAQASHHHHRRRAAATNPAHNCCLRGCTWQDLLALCPH